jgi:hypothetical protein
VGGLPIPSSFLALIDGATNGWLRMLDSLPPADAAGDLRALPFTAGWLAAAVGIELLRRSERVGLPALGPLFGLAVSILFSVEERRLVLLQGVILGVLFLVLCTVQFDLAHGAASPQHQRFGRFALGASVVVGVAVLAPLARCAGATGATGRPGRAPPVPAVTVRPAVRSQPPQRAEGLSGG